MPDSEFLRRVAATRPLPNTSGGASGFFSAPSADLDPNLFDGNSLRPEVRSFILGELYHGLSMVFGGHPEIDTSWLYVWLAGSGVTHQWAADRGNGDLDVLFSMDVTQFEQANKGWRGWSERDLADAVNEGLKAQLWPTTSQVQLGNRLYEVTFFWNAGTGTDIRHIHPYAAYDVRGDTWSVPPPELPADPRTLYPASWYEAASRDADVAAGLSEAYAKHLSTLASSAADSPDYHNASSLLNMVVTRARALWDDIHLGRREAFGDQGHGYGDFHNFRWQSAKQSGAAEALRAIASVADEARRAEETERYGSPIDAADVVLRRAMQQYRNRS